VVEPSAEARCRVARMMDPSGPRSASRLPSSRAISDPVMTCSISPRERTTETSWPVCIKKENHPQMSSCSKVGLETVTAEVELLSVYSLLPFHTWKERACWESVSDSELISAVNAKPARSVAMVCMPPMWSR